MFNRIWPVDDEDKRMCGDGESGGDVVEFHVDAVACTFESTGKGYNLDTGGGMPDWIVLLAGLLLVAVATVDMLWSTISINGGGPIANSVAVAFWKSSRFVYVRTSSHRVLEFATVVILVATFFAWVVLKWVGWTLVFSAGDAVVIHESAQEQAGFFDRAYFSGMVYLTLGTGDFVATSVGWRLWTIAASLSGLVTITLTISYLVSVVSVAVEKRHLASLIWGAGRSSDHLVVNGWDGESFSILDDRLNELGHKLMRHSECHLAYPVLQYYHPTDPRAALPPGLAVLEDTMIIMEHCVHEEYRPSQTTLRLLRQAIDLYVDRVELQHISRVDEAPKEPHLNGLRRAGIPICDREECRQHFADHAERRRLLWGLIVAEGWHWPRSPQRERAKPTE